MLSRWAGMLTLLEAATRRLMIRLMIPGASKNRNAFGKRRQREAEFYYLLADRCTCCYATRLVMHDIAGLD